MLQLTVNVTYPHGKPTTQLQLRCCDTLTEDIAHGVMRCAECSAAYPLAHIREMLAAASAELQELSDSLAA